MNHLDLRLPATIAPNQPFPNAMQHSAMQHNAIANTESDNPVMGEFVTIEDAAWYRITNSHLMPEFFMSIVSSSDHWMFISSKGALTAGRQNADSAMFPYYSADKIVDTSASTGPKTLLRISKQNGDEVLWEPFSAAPIRDETRVQNLYKNAIGNQIRFEEVHHELGLVFRYTWASGHQFGFIRQCELLNTTNETIQTTVTDGLQNLLPSGLGKDFQLRFSNLADAYKKNELESECGLGLYYLSSIPTDRAEPNEGLTTSVAWQHGLDTPAIAISNDQWENIRRGDQLKTERDVRGRRGAYFISKQLETEPHQTIRWSIVADVNYDHTDVTNLREKLLEQTNQAADHGTDIGKQIADDISENEAQLLEILSATDGRQMGENRSRIHRHQSSVLFNVMRGGFPARGYEVDTADFRNHARQLNRTVAQRCETFLANLPETIRIDRLQSEIFQTGDLDLIRIASEYLPLTFSRRHGDPTRPWNEFSIDVWTKEGKPNLTYQGNWRDIFQNWEALAVSYPQFAVSMIFRFVNASTADGHNPYRISKNGFDWEVPDTNDPWANIGYWGDHQIIYLLELLKRGRAMTPSRLNDCLSQPTCTYADIPYRIRSAESLFQDPQTTIDFDLARAAEIDRRVEAIGSDGTLLWRNGQEPYHVELIEKLLVPVLAKLTNFVPGGGVWLNTQRPEWNDANNALVGNGLSVVTACYLRQYLSFLIDWFESDKESIPESANLSREVADLADRINEIVTTHASSFTGPINDVTRRQILNQLANAGSDYRANLYAAGMSGEKTAVPIESLVKLLQRSRIMIDHTIASNRRDDGMYHAYNLMHLSSDSAAVIHLYEMLEGQVAVLSSGLLTAAESLSVLDSLRGSRMYRADQQSYMLYPDRELPRFLDKNHVSPESVLRSKLVQQMLADGNTTLVRRDVLGNVHFNRSFCNSADLIDALDTLRTTPTYRDLASSERDLLVDIYEDTFQHRSFTGRSGTFFGYEGLGSIYWHMVSKLALAVMNLCVEEREANRGGRSQALPGLLQHYRDICRGIGSTKTPSQYGAFPSDPYSHSPAGAGVQQPGMTGQVKEDILSRWSEIGIRIKHGQLRFDPIFFDITELMQHDSSLDFVDVGGNRSSLPVPTGCFAMTLCQVPIVYCQSDQPGITVHRLDQPQVVRDDLALTTPESESLFARRGEITLIEVRFCPT
ncbi:hypothetical protein [Rubripirellula reticaptiva]|uniref:Glycosyl hydrolase 36 catalytic domain-containing protein n=1 Tax=Rubripirellula reticaptiva TaxID=2528013 RepID=A0A5C6F5V1_9BACT|nr:hypothetical protein [Rubripirellula reticaptiva]TWU55904.1 hypothetical protein Poly59_22070 [Rubripirellula reticaptiva]